MRKTDMLYYNDQYQRQFEAQVLDVAQVLDGGVWRVVLDATCFYPEGGGQPADFGYLSGCAVVDCQVDDGVIYHMLVMKPNFDIGDTVRGAIDIQRRLVFMQNHTGEHLLSGLAKSLFGATNVGFHMSARGFTIDFDIPLSREQLDEMENEANVTVWTGCDIETYFVAGDDVDGLEARAKRDFAASDVARIVEIGEYDTCACAGLHVEHIAEVGAIKIVAHQRYKGGTRIQVYCGADALWDYTRKNDMLRQLSGLLSAETESIVAAVDKLKEARAAAKRDADALKQRYFALLAERVEQGAKLVWFVEDGLDADDLRRLANLAAERAQIAVALSVDGAVCKYAASSADEAALRDFAARLGAACDGKGGVAKGVAQGALKADFAAITAFLEGWA